MGFCTFPCLLWVWKRALAEDTGMANMPSPQTGMVMGRQPTGLP